MIAGTGSGVGKTAITCGIIRGFMQRGYTVQPFKAGPDYIDPGHLSHISGQDACNLDIWLMGDDGVKSSIAKNSTSDISVIEGVMGFYDGFEGGSDIASTYQISKITDTPVILVIDARGAARSVAAIAKGFAEFSTPSNIRGVILNRLGSDRHSRLCRDALDTLGIPILGAVPRNSDITLKSRHLGLVPAAESDVIRDRLDTATGFILDHIDMDSIVQLASGAPPIISDKPPVYRTSNIAKTVISVAQDDSFNFYYKDNLDRLRNAGARLEFFSPETSDNIPECDGLYLGGGFPEVRAHVLEKNHTIRARIKEMAQDGVPIYAECGGLMYLARTIRHQNISHAMAGLFDADAIMTGKVTLNYTKGVMRGGPLTDGIVGFSGHEFHYSRLDDIDTDARFAQTLDIGVGIDNGMDGMRAYETMASYGHLYFTRDAAESWVQRCMKYSRM